MLVRLVGKALVAGIILALSACTEVPGKSPSPKPAKPAPGSGDGVSTPQPERPLAERMRGALELLRNRLARLRPLSGEIAVAVDNVVRADVPYTGSVGPYLRMKISEALSASSSFVEIEREEIDRITKELGFSLKDLVDPNAEGSKLGKIRPAHAVVKTKFVEFESSVTLTLSLIDVQTSEVSSTTLDVKKRELPVETTYKPTNHDAMVGRWNALQAGSLRENDFQIRLALDRQSGAVYRLGDTLNVIFRSERDCYLKLYHVSDGGIKLLFPNRWHRDNFVPANTLVRIPSARMAFDYLVVRPLGAEVIKAVASARQFSDMADVTRRLEGSAFPSLGEANESNMRGLTTKGLDVTGKGATAEDTCLFTIVE